MRTDLHRRPGEKPSADWAPAYLHDRKAVAFNGEAAAAGFTMPGHNATDFNAMDDRALLTLRADLRRLLNVWTDKAHAAVERDDSAAAERFADATQVAGAYINDVSNILDNRAASPRGAGAEALLNGATGERLPILRNAADFRAHYDRNVTGADRDVTLHDFLKGVAGLRTTDAVRAALSEGTSSAGGYTVPSLIAPKILEALVPASSLLSAGAGVVPLTEQQSQTTFVALDTVPTAAWRAENGNVAESDPAFRAVVVKPKSLAFLFKVSRELLADGIGLEAGLYTAIAQSFAVALDKAGLRGAGSATEPRGILNTSGIQSVTNGAAGASLQTSIKYTGILSAAQKIAEANGPEPTAAIMSPRSQYTLAGLVDTPGQPVRRPPIIEGMKFVSTTAIPNDLTVGGSTDCSEIYVADFTRCAFALRETMNVQVARELYAGTGQVAFVCHVRADFACWYPAAFALVTGVRP